MNQRISEPANQRVGESRRRSIAGSLYRVGHIDWGILLALALSLVAAAPFLTRPALPHQTDAELHVYRAAELGHILREGVLYPRWAPDLYLGYGYPIFNYYAPFTYYLANLFALLPGLGIVTGVKAVFVTGLVLASLGTYLLGRDLFDNSIAGVLAAASFTFAPYVVFVDPHARGDLAEHFAVCLLPLTFYFFRRLMSRGGRGALLGGVLSLAALVFSHNLMGLVASGLLLAYWIWEITLGVGRRRAGWGLLAFALAAAIIAFFWLPALLERDAIKLEVIGPGHFDFREHFLSLGELLAPSRILDLGATAPHYRFNLGLPQWLLGLSIMPVLVQRGRESRSRAFFALSALGLILLMLPASKPIWERIPGMPYLQFPWRLLGPTNLMVAVCSASVVALLRDTRSKWRDLASAAALGAILLSALPVLYPPMWEPDFGGTSPRDIIQWERRSQALGTTSTGDFLPTEAALVPMRPADTLLASYEQPGPVDRVNRATVPDAATVEVVDGGALHDRFLVSTPKRFVLRLYTFYFPGWRAYVDGDPVEIEVAGPEGFITLWVPEGEHEVLVRFEDTPPRTVGWIISAVGLAALVLSLVLMQESSKRTSSTARRWSLVWLGGTLALFVTLKVGVIDPRDNWLRYTSPPGQALAAQHSLHANFGGEIEFLGYDLPQRRVRSGEELSVVLYWHALKPLEKNYQSFVHLARPLHILWGQDDHLNPGGLPTTRWPVDKYVWDEYEVRVLPGTPPGEYKINVGLYSMAEGYRLQRETGGDSLVLDAIEVTRPRRQPRPSELGMAQDVMAEFPEGNVTLLGYLLSSDRVKVSDPWSVTLFWRADARHPSARVRDVVLSTPDGREIKRCSGEPVAGAYPFNVWRSGEVIRDPLLFPAPQSEELEPGTYQLGMTLKTDDAAAPEGSTGATISLGNVTFVAEK